MHSVSLRLAKAVLISVDELLDFRSAALIFTSQRRMSLGLHRFARTSPGHSMKCPKPVRKAGSLQRCQQYWLHFMRRELFIVHQRTSSTRRSKKREEKRKLSPRLRDPHESSSFSLGWNVPVRNADKRLRRSLEQNKMQKAPVVRRMRTGSAGSWPAAGPWLITGGEAATTTYLSSRAETKC